MDAAFGITKLASYEHSEMEKKCFRMSHGVYNWQVHTGGMVGGSQGRVREEAMPFILSHDVTEGTPPGWREARYAWKVSASRCDPQQCSLLFFLITACNL